MEAASPSHTKGNQLGQGAAQSTFREAPRSVGGVYVQLPQHASSVSANLKQMNAGGKRGALASNSLAEVAMAFVFFCVLLLLVALASVAAVLFLVLAPMIDAPPTAKVYLTTTWATWGLLVAAFWIVTVRRLRRTPSIDASTGDFFRFQLGAALCVLGFWVLFAVAGIEPQDLLHHLGTVFNVLLVLFNITYLSFAWVSKERVSARSYAGVFLAIAVVLLSSLL